MTLQRCRVRRAAHAPSAGEVHSAGEECLAQAVRRESTRKPAPGPRLRIPTTIILRKSTPGSSGPCQSERQRAAETRLRMRSSRSRGGRASTERLYLRPRLHRTLDILCQKPAERDVNKRVTFRCIPPQTLQNVPPPVPATPTRAPRGAPAIGGVPYDGFTQPSISSTSPERHTMARPAKILPSARPDAHLLGNARPSEHVPEQSVESLPCKFESRGPPSRLPTVRAVTS